MKKQNAINKLNEFIKFSAPFIRNLNIRYGDGIGNGFKVASYAQAASSFAIFINNKNGGLEIYFCIFLFPMLITLGAAFGMTARKEASDGRLLSILLLIFCFLSVFNIIAIAIFMFSTNFLAGIVFVISVFLTLISFLWVVRFYFEK